VDFISTRNARRAVSGIKAVVEGLSEEGGLFVPAFFPSVDGAEMEKMLDMIYPQRAAFIIGKYLPELAGELDSYTEKAYSRFDGDPAPLVKLDDSLFVLELWHGPTHAFKDIALTLLPYLLTGSKKLLEEKERTLILVATSGDTGKAALEGFKDVPGADIIVFYPGDGVSALQKLQMITQAGGNVYVAGINGNFDDAQSGVKKLFADKELAAWMEERGYQFSSANSINIGRLVPQIVYYVYAYAQLVKEGRIKAGEEINVTVPTGNFGNILAAYYAKNMGLPIKKLICASNDNKVLYDFFRTGAYDRNRDFILTTSPSMDILISSNLERLIYRIAGENAACNASLMAALAGDGKYEITAEMKEKLGDFYGNYATQEECAAQIRSLYEDTDYVLDPHTAVAAAVYNKYKEETGDTTKTVIASTASPYKFTRTVMSAMDEKYADMDDFALTEELEKISGVKIPDAITKIRNAPVLHNIQCEKDGMKQAVMEFLEKQ